MSTDIDNERFIQMFREEGVRRAATVARIEATLKEYEAQLLEGDYAGAEKSRQKLHDLYDIVCDGVAGIAGALRKLHGLM